VLTLSNCSLSIIWKSSGKHQVDSETVFEKLAPGEYRVSAKPISQKGKYDPTPFAVSDVISLGGQSEKIVLTLKLEGNNQLIVNTFNAETAMPMPETYVYLFGADGFPIGSRSSTDANGVFTYGHRSAGKYNLEIFKWAWYYNDIEYRPEHGRVSVRVRDGKGSLIEVPLRPVTFSQAEINKRWPFIVQGIVTNNNGRSLEGVKLRVNCGIGTLWPKGSTTTGADGRYTLRFSSGSHSKEESSGKWVTPLQAARIAIEKADYYEKTNGSKRSLFIALKLPPENNIWDADPKKVILPGKPYVLNFVMFPEVGPAGKPDMQVEGEALRGSYEIIGTVYDPVSDSWWEDFFTKLEAAESEKEFDQILKRPSDHLAVVSADSVVTLRGSSLTQETVTDAEEKYKFIGLSAGSYVISCEKTETSTRTGEERIAVAKNGVQFKPNFPDRGRTVDLRLHDDYITVKGRITDANGHPVAGAKVVGTAAPITTAFEAWSEHSGEDPRTVSTVSKADGLYELSGIDPANLIALTRYLANGSPGDELGYGFFVDIIARADDFVQSNNKAKRVPLVTEEILYRARRFFKAYSQVVRRTGGKETQEKQDLPYPFSSSHGNTITGIDIVVEQIGTGVQVEGGKVWGEAVEDAKIRLLNASPIWGRSDWPHPVVRLRLGARNEGERYLHRPENGLDWQIEVDGLWYEWVNHELRDASIDAEETVVSRVGRLLDFNTGDSHAELTVDIASNWWQIPGGKQEGYAQRRWYGWATISNDDYGRELVLKSGLHRIRVAITCPPLRASWQEKPVRLISNPIEIKIF
jgi:hypothetical protein